MMEDLDADDIYDESNSKEPTPLIRAVDKLNETKDLLTCLMNICENDMHLYREKPYLTLILRIQDDLDEIKEQVMANLGRH